MNRVRLLDICIALLTAFLVSQSPFAPKSTGASLAIGAASGLFYLWYRSTHPRLGLAGTASDWLMALRRVPPGVAIALALWVGVFAQALLWMYARWTGSFWHNNHSLIIAVLMVLLARSALRKQRDAPFDVSLWGLPLLAAGVFLAVLDSGTRNQQLASIGLVLSLPGMVLLLLGRTRLRALALPLLLGVFLIPLPSLIANHLLLRNITAQWTLDLLQWLGVRASMYYTQIELPREVFEVSEACSGFSTLMAAIALATFMAALCRSTWRRVALVAAILPLTLAANTLRVLSLVLMSMYFGTGVLDTMLHEASGVATFVVVVGALFLLADRPSLVEALR